jgi:hypothetical protein
MRVSTRHAVTGALRVNERGLLLGLCFGLSGCYRAFSVMDAPLALVSVEVASSGGDR